MHGSAHRRIGNAGPFCQVDFDARQFDRAQHVDTDAKHLKSCNTNCFFGPGYAAKQARGHFGADRNAAGYARGRGFGPRRHAEGLCGITDVRLGESSLGQRVSHPPF